jgi:hypothetical protein
LAPVLHRNYLFKSPMYRRSREMFIPRIALSALFAPYRAKPGTATGFLAPTPGGEGMPTGMRAHPPPGPPPLRRRRAPASQPLLNCSSDEPKLYVLPMEKHELELVTSTCTMSYNVLLHDCTRHTSGITGHLLSFLITLYRDSIVPKSIGEAPGILSDPIPIERGLRQGCLVSPILFNIFINDIFDGIEELG